MDDIQLGWGLPVFWVWIIWSFGNGELADRLGRRRVHHIWFSVCCSPIIGTIVLGILSITAKNKQTEYTKYSNHPPVEWETYNNVTWEREYLCEFIPDKQDKVPNKGNNDE